MIENEKEAKLSSELESCRTAIAREKRLIIYHKGLQKKQESRERLIISKLDKLKMKSFIEMINKHGYDIDNLRNAVSVGDFSGVSVQKTESVDVKEKNENMKVQTAPKLDEMQSEEEIDDNSAKDAD